MMTFPKLGIATMVLFGLVAMGNAQSSSPAVFVTNNVGDSITSMQVNSDGSLSYVGTYNSGDGPQAISLTPDGRFLSVTHGTAATASEELRLFSVNSDASLTHILTMLVPDSPLDVQWLSNEYLAVTETSLSSDNHVRTFRYDDVANALSPEDVDFTGDFNTRLDLRDDSQFLFANSSLGSNTIYSFSVDGGTLTEVDAELMGSNFAVDIKASHDGNFLYGAGGISGDDHRVFGFAVDSGGALSPLATPSFTSPGAAPKVIDITADDLVLVAGHGGDGTARTFLRDPVNGGITATNFSFNAGGQGSLGDLQVMGDLLFVSNENDRTVTSLRVNSDGSLTQLGSPVGTVGSRPEYLATWEGLLAIVCDFDSDSDCDLDDINALLSEGPIAGGVPVTAGTNEQFDLNADGTIDLLDRDLWLAEAGAENGFSSPLLVADANLDGVVDGLDFIAWNDQKFTATLQWNFGDFNGDGVADGLDFIEWNTTKFTSSDTVAVPEPSGIAILLALAIAAFSRRRV